MYTSAHSPVDTDRASLNVRIKLRFKLRENLKIQYFIILFIYSKLQTPVLLPEELVGWKGAMDVPENNFLIRCLLWCVWHGNNFLKLCFKCSSAV